MKNREKGKASKGEIGFQRPKNSSETIGDIDSYLGYWLRFVSNQVSSSFQQRLLEKDVTVAEWIALRFLYSHAPCSLTKLAEEMGMDKGAVSRLVDRLEKRAFIQRTISQEDRRLYSLELTAQGSKIVPVLSKVAEENDHYFFGHLSKKDNSFMVRVLKDLVNHHGLKKKPVD